MGKSKAPPKQGPTSTTPTKTKDRQGGAKVRKALPPRRLGQAIARLQAQSERRRQEQGRQAALQAAAVQADPTKALDGPAYQAYLQGAKVARPDPRKLCRLLMPNARF